MTDPMPSDIDSIHEIDSRPATGAAAIEVRGLSFERAGRLVLNDINLCVEPGQIAAVMGANGAGKTTLLRCLAGLAQPTSGHVLWFGQSPRRSVALRRAIGMVAHQDWLYAELTPRENLLFAAGMYNVGSATARVEQLLSESGLLPYAKMGTDQLSHGMRRRLSVCRALVHGPRILLLDEPFSGLDADGQQWLGRLLVQLRATGVAICLTTHHYELAQRIVDRLLKLSGGQLHDRTREFCVARQLARPREHAA